MPETLLGDSPQNAFASKRRGPLFARQCTFDLTRSKPTGAHIPPLTVRLADTDDQRSAANMLVKRLYARRGYGSDHRLPRQDSSVSFSAANGERVIGTLTLTVDSPAGLALDSTFAEELQPFRRVTGAKLCELTKFAFDTATSSMPYLAALFHIIFIFGTRWHDCTDLFIEVNPRHRRFYQAMLGFQPIGGLKTNAAVSAPSQLMWLRVADIRRLIDEHAGRQGATHSLYPYFFSPKEEQGIYGRLIGQGGRHRSEEPLSSVTRERMLHSPGGHVQAPLAEAIPIV